MLVDYKTSSGVLVVTQSGQKLGRLYSLWINIDTHQIVKYVVRKKSYFSLKYKEFLIAPQQIIGMSETKIIVEDNVEKESAVNRILKKDIWTKAVSVNTTRSNIR